MESAKEIIQANSANPRIRAETMEKVLLKGDLTTLTPAERLHYYNSVCTSVGLNPLTKPFDYLNLNGKLILYANRGCTEQLRQIHQVRLTIKGREAIENCYVVTASAMLPDGRQDESIGAVSLEGLKGEGRANAMMKAETKAKRRVTLSICGLTFLDESEIDSTAGARRVAETGEDDDPIEQTASNFREMIEAFAGLKKQLGSDHEDIYYSVLRRFNVAHSNEFKSMLEARSAYRELKEAIANFPPAQTGTT